MLNLVNLIGPAILAFILASALAWWDLVKSEYPQTIFLIKTYWPLYLYAAMYGFGGGIIMLVLDWNVLGIKFPVISNRWLQALAVGLLAKALQDIRIFSITIGTRDVPIAIGTVPQLIEPTLLRYIRLYEFSELMKVLQPRVEKYVSFEDVKQRIMSDGLPRSFGLTEKKAFETDLKKTEDTVGAMELYLRRFGRVNFDRVFPLLD